MSTPDQNQAGKGVEQPVVVLTRTMLVSDEENDRRLYEEQKTEDAYDAAHSALSANAGNMFVILFLWSVMFPFKYLHYV